MRRSDGESILLWTLPVLALIWLSVFLLFPGFAQPMSPTMSAQEVAAFYRDPDMLPRIRYSMIVFNWFAVGLIPLLALIAMQIRRMAHRTPIFSYSIIACAAGGPTPNAAITSGVVVIALIKVRLILREFMEVRHAPPLLCRLTDLWVVGTGVSLLGCYFVGMAVASA